MLRDATLPESQLPATKVEQPAPDAGGYSLRPTPIDAASRDLLAEWRAFGASNPSPMRDPEWLRGYFEGQTTNLRLYSLFQSEVLCGAAPFLKKDWPIKWHLGELCVATFPLKRLRLLGGPPAFPESEYAYDLLFSRVLSEGGFDALFFEEIPVDSFFWRYLHSSPLIRKSFSLYQPDPIAPHPVLRLEGTFEQYMGKFSSKHRNTLQRKIKKLRESPLGEMRLDRYESPDQVDAFLDQAIEISKKTYQWQLHQRGLSAIDLLRRRLRFASENGWMRCYLLFCGGRAVAFILGYQFEGTFFLDEIGHEPELSKYSPGSVLQLLCVEDLFRHNRARMFDLQDTCRYKEELSTETYPHGRLFLFRKGIYPSFLRTGHRICASISRCVSSRLDRLGMKSRVKKLVRRLGSSH